MSELPAAPKSVGQRLFRNPVLWVFLVTLVALALHPIPECVDCEFPRPWGRNDIAYQHASEILTIWFVVATTIAGFFSIRKYWLVPVVITLAHASTQPLGGVPFWSLKPNEGPMIVLLGLGAGVLALAVGAIVRILFDLFADRFPLHTPQ
jgi:hypothetical protein